MKLKLWRSKGPGPFVGMNRWRSRIYSNWYLQFWIGSNHLCLSYGATR